MGKYKHDMSGESQRKQLLPEGERTFRIMDCKETVSKSGNEMFEFTVRDLETQQDETLYAISQKGKRWFLKSILNACKIEAGQDGVYEWDIDDVIDKEFTATVSHYTEPWVNREGKTVETTKHKIENIREVVPF